MTGSHSPDRDDLTEALRIAQRLGVISATDLDREITHCERFAAMVPRETESLLDLGSGGGLPALVVAVLRPEIEMTLIERREKRADILRRQVARLNLGSRTEVICAGTETHQVSGEFAGHFDAVTARSFGSPEQTARAAAHYLKLGGLLLVSEPPGSSGGRWSPCAAEHGLRFLAVRQAIAQLQKL